VIMNDGNLQIIEQVRQFLGGSEALFFRALSMGEKYNWIEEVMTPYQKLKSLLQAHSLIRINSTSLLPLA